MKRQGQNAPIVAVLLAIVAAASAATGQTAGDSPTALENREVRTTVLRGSPPTPPPPPRPVEVLPGGDINLNFPAVDIQAVAKAVLGDILHAPYTLDPSLHNAVTLQTSRPIRRAEVVPQFEAALTRAGLVLVNRSGSFSVATAAMARGEAAVVGPADAGFGNETLPLQFVNAEEMRKLLDPLVPNAISVTDPTHNVLVVSGNSTQRKALRDLVSQFDVDWLKGMSFALFVPQRTDARLIAPELEKLLNAPGTQSAGLVRLIAMDRLNGILAITAQPQYLDDTRRFVEILDREGEGAEKRVFVYHVQNGRAADLAKVLNAAFGNGGSGGAQTDTDPTSLNDRSGRSPSTLPAGLPAGLTGGLPGRGAITLQAAGAITSRGGSASGQGGDGTASGTSITADETNNAIVVFSVPRDYALISDALAKLDVPPLQVMIDASITEVTLNHDLRYGLQWAFQAGRLGGALSQGVQRSTVDSAGNVTGVTNPGPLQTFPGLSFLYQGNGFSATLNALAKVTDVTVLSAPKLMVLNNHTATIQVGQQVPISTGSAVSTISSGAPIVNSIEYRDTGIILKVTPRVNSGGLVLLDIAQEVSSVLGTTSSGISSPSIQQRKIATSVAVQDGETVALGGLISNQVTKGNSSIPVLGRIPVLGHLFGDTTGGQIRTELVVLLTPRVVRSPVDARAVTDELRENIHLGAPPPPRHHAP